MDGIRHMFTPKVKSERTEEEEEEDVLCIVLFFFSPWKDVSVVINILNESTKSFGS